MKTMKKRTLSWLLVMTMLLSLLPMQVFASTAPEIAVADETVVITDGAVSVTVPVEIKNNTGFAGMELIFSTPDGWTLTTIAARTRTDYSVLYVEDEWGDKALACHFTPNTANGKMLVAGSVDITGNGILCWLTYSIPADAEAGEYDITITPTKINNATNTATDISSSFTFTAGTIKVIRPGVNLSSASVEVDGTNGATVTATAIDSTGADITATADWSVAPADQGVTIAADGTITVAAKAQAGAYTIKAGDMTATLNVARKAAEVTEVVVSPASASIARPVAGGPAATKQFTAKVYDQYGSEITGKTISWSATAGTIDNAGELTITNEVHKGSYEVKATIGDVSGTAAVAVTEVDRVVESLILKQNGVEVTSETVAVAAPATGSKTEEFTAVAYDQYGDEMDASAIQWSKVITDAEVTVSDGEITIPAGCGTGSVVLTATSGNASKTITVNIADIEFNYEGAVCVGNSDTTYGKTWSEYLTINNAITAMLGDDVVTGTYSLSVDASAKPNVDTYTINVLFNGSGYENVVVGSVSYTVTKASVEVPTAITGLTYTAETQTGVADGENYSITGNTAADAGSYTAIASLDNQTNYQWADGTTADKNIEWSVSPAALSIESVTVAGKTYDATTDATISNVVFSGLKSSDTLTAGTDYSVSAKFANANAGESVNAAGTVTLLNTANAKNYTLADGSFTSTAKIEPNASFTDATTKNQNVVVGVGSFTEPSFKGIGSETVEGTMTYSYGGETKSKTDIETALKSLNKGDTTEIGYSFTASGNYSGTKSGTINVTLVDILFKVGDADATIDNAVTIKANPVYGDTWADIVTQKTIVGSVDGDEVEGEYKLNVSGTPDAGEQTFKVIFNGGRYTNVEVVSGTVNIAKKPVNVVWTGDSFTYNGAEQAPAASIADADLVGEDTVELSITGKGTAAGEYTAAAATTNTNYELGNTTKTYTIGRKSVAVVWTNEALTYNGAEQAPTATVDTGIEGETLTVDVAGSAKNADSYTATASTTNTNYTLTNTSKAFTISRKSVTITGIDAANKTYDGTAAAEITGTAALDGKIGNDDVTVTVGTAAFADKNTGTGKAVTFAGFALTGAAADNYTLSAQPASVTADITAKSVAVVWDYFEGLTFTGSAQKPTATVDTGIEGETLTVTVTGEGTNVGSYTATASISDTNYTLTNTSKDFAIAKATAPTLSVSGTTTYKYTITGEKAVTVTGVPTDKGTVDYTVGAVTGQTTALEGTPVIDDATGVLTFVLAADIDDVDETVTIPVTAVMQNYEDASVNVVITIKEKDVPTAAAEDITMDYTGTALTADAIQTEGQITFEDQTVEGDWVWVTDPATLVTAGTYSAEVKFVPTDRTNYAEVTDTITVTVNKIKVTVPTAAANLVYNGEAQTGVTDGDHYSVADNIQTNAGNYTATVRLDDTANYEWATEFSGSIDWSIAKATPTGEPAFTKVTTSGKTLADAGLTTEGGTFSVPGTVAWAAPNTEATEVKANQEYGWIFTPTDITNYNTLADTIRVWRRSSGGGSSTPVAPVEPEKCDGGKDCAAKPYADVNTALWYHEAVDYALTKGFMVGLDKDTFGPEVSVTRGMVVTVLWSLEGKPAAPAGSFNDVAADAWYANAVNWAASKGIVSGYSADSFGAEDLITREQMATILRAYAKVKGQDISKANDLSTYTDADQIADWAKTAVAWANAEGLMSGRSATELAPKGTTKRAELAAMLMGFLAEDK